MDYNPLNKRKVKINESPWLWMDGRTDRWTDEWADERTNELLKGKAISYTQMPLMNMERWWI